jgi:glycosyltransferase involved in cell wall biosynthesis
LALAERMDRRGHAVALLVLRPPLAQQWPTALNAVHLGMRRSPLSLLTILARGRRFLIDFRPDLLHSHSFHANVVARLLKLLVPSPVLLSTVHNVYEGGWLRMLAYRLTDSLARHTTAVSQAAADRFVRLKAVPKHKCSVLSNGIDTVEFAPEAERRARARELLSAGEEFVWLAVGRIAPAKDYPNLLRTFVQVTAACPGTQLWVAGEGASSECSRLLALAQELGLTEAVRWLGLRRDLPALLDAADAYVLASAWEGMPLALGEAMAMEKPVVATDVGGVRELAADTGRLVPSGNSDALAAAMLETMRLPADDRRALGRAARVRIQSHFSMEARADQWEALYRANLEKRWLARVLAH